MSAASKALEKYGFANLAAGGFVLSNPRTGNPRTRYIEMPGGFERYEYEGGAWRQYPFSIHPDWEGVAGLAFDAKQAASDPNSRVKPECFEWIYPPEFITNTYGG